MSDRTFVRHVVMFSAKNKADVARIREGLLMLKNIPGSTVFEVVENSGVDTWSGEIDVVVYAEFPDHETMATYKEHPTYKACIDVVKPLRDIRIAADF